MAEINCVVRIDVSKATLDVFVLPHQDHIIFNNDASGIQALLGRLLEYDPKSVVLEATGGLEFKAARALADAGLSVHRVNPCQIHNFRKSLGKHAKTDKLDAA